MLSVLIPIVFAATLPAPDVCWIDLRANVEVDGFVVTLSDVAAVDAVDAATKARVERLELGRFEETLREVRVARLVPVELDADGPTEWTDAERAELLGIEAAALAGLGRGDESADLAREALALDPDERRAREALEGPGR